MNENEFYRKKNELINKFLDGHKRYQNSAVFNNVIQSLVRDADPYEIIDNLCQLLDEEQQLLEKAYKEGLNKPITLKVGSLSDLPNLHKKA